MRFILIALLFPSLALAQSDLLSIGFNHVGKVSNPIKFEKSVIVDLFPGMDVQHAEVESSYQKRDGFVIRLRDNEEPIFFVKSQHGSKFVFSIFTRSNKVKGPNGSIIGKSTYGEMKNLPWSGCSWGLNSLSNTMVCYSSNLRALFDSPKEFNGDFREASDADVSKAVLSELMYWTGRPK